MDPLWIAVAFIFGFAVKQIGLPPLVGFLATGFVLNQFGVQGGETLDRIADFGILLLLFSIGLKLNLKSLLRPQIWATASLHMAIVVALFGAGCFGLSYLGLSSFADLDFRTSLLIAFALSFSSTVFAVKILEEKGEMAAPHGRIAIGILIMQDIFAVMFLTLSTGNLPSPWALLLLALLLIRPLLKKSAPLSVVINRSGHGELLVLLGILLPFAAAALFKLVGMKPDLGALVLGVVLSGHPKAKELSNAMLSFKDLFLVGFFLTIGLSGTPDLAAWGIAFLFALVLPVKTGLFFLLLTRLKLRAGTATLSSLSLANYSEFGLIVGAAGAAHGWIGPEWLVIFALTLSISFVLASPLNVASHALYARGHQWLQGFETEERLPEDEPVVLGDAEVVVLGMGRIGTEVHDVLARKYGQKVLGIDYDKDIVLRHQSAGRNIMWGDATDFDFRHRLAPSPLVRLVILAASNHATHLEVLTQVKERRQSIMVAALCRYDDEMEELKQAGADVIFDLYSEAGLGFAEEVYGIYRKTEV